MALTKDDIRGIFPPMVTPFDDSDDLDLGALRREAAFLVEAGVHGLVVGGSTGEGASMSGEEVAAAAGAVVEEVRGRVPVLAGVIADYTRDAVRRGLLAREAGVDGLMVTPVHYTVPSPEGNVEYYTQVTQQVGLPVLIYNVIPRAPVKPAVLKRLVEIPGVVGVKESIGGNLDTLAEILATIGDKVSVTFAIDPYLFHGFVLGAHGTISGIATVVPHLITDLWDAVQRGDLPEARKLNNRMNLINNAYPDSGVNWPSWIKASINLQGRQVGKARSPMVRLTEQETENLRAAMRKAEVL